MICKNCSNPKDSRLPWHASCLGGCNCFCNFICGGCSRQLKDTVSVVDCWYLWFTTTYIFVFCRACYRELRLLSETNDTVKIEYWEYNELRSTEDFTPVNTHEKRN